LKNLPFDFIGLGADEVELLEDIYKALDEKFDIYLPDNQYVNNFEAFNNNENASLGGTIVLNDNCYLTFVKVHYPAREGRGISLTEYFKYQVWAFVNLEKDFGRVLIRQETFTDKILELIHPQELHFHDDKAFNNRFYVITNDQEKALSAINSNFREVLINNNGDDFVIETINQVLVIRNNNVIDTNYAVSLAEFAIKLATV
jgi:hypothetical protein